MPGKSMVKMLVVIVSGSLCVMADAWDTGVFNRSTHRLIVKKGQSEMSPQDEELNKYQEQLWLGCDQENHEGDTAHKGTNWGTNGIQIWWDEARSDYKSSLTSMLQGDFGGADQRKLSAYFKLGCMMHLICDMGVPAHGSHVGHGFGYGFAHIDNLELMGAFNWRPDWARSSENDYNGRENGDPEHTDICEYYEASQIWNIYDLTNEYSDVGKGWLKKYYTPPVNPYDNSKDNWGHYSSKNLFGRYFDVFDTTWTGWSEYNKKCCMLLSKRQNRTSYIAKWALKCACAEFKKLRTDAGVSSELLESFLGYKSAHELYRAVPSLGAEPPANDNFADAVELLNASGQVTGNNTGATLEEEEPCYNCSQESGNSVWWKWTAPTSGLYGFDTDGSDFETSIAIYRGGSMKMLMIEACDNETGICLGRSYCWLSATQGATYYIAVLGGVSEKDFGNITLNYYPEENITWADNGVSETNNSLSTFPATNGSIASISGSTSLQSRSGTTQKGFPITFNDNYDFSRLRLTVTDVKGKKLVDSVRPEGVGPNENFTILGFDGKLLMLGAYDPSSLANNILTLGEISTKLLLFKVGKGGMTSCGTCNVDNFSTASLKGGNVTALQCYATGDGDLYMMLLGMDCKMRQTRALSSLPPGYRIAETFGDDLVACIYEGDVSTVVRYVKLKKSGATTLVEHTITKDSGENLYVAPDKNMGLLYWKEKDWVKGGVSYVNSKNEVVFENLTLEGAGPTWNSLFFDGKEFYVDTLGDYSVITHYSLRGRQIKTGGSRICLNYYGMRYDAGSVYVMEYSDDLGSCACYDKDFKGVKFQVQGVPGTPEYIGSQTISFISESLDGIHTCSLYKKGKPLTTQSFK